MQLFKAEHRHLDGYIVALGIETGAITQAGQLFTQHHLGGKVHHGHIGHLADVGHSTGGTGVYLDDIDLTVVYNILDVHQAHHIQARRPV